MLESEILDCLAEDADDHPEHLEFQRFIREACQEIQSTWCEKEERRRRTQIIEPLEIEEVLGFSV